MADQPLWKTFLDRHVRGSPLVMANPWDVGSAKLFASLGFEALATTSSGYAATFGRTDGEVSRDEMIAHAGELTRATGLPVNADLENGYADDPAGVAGTVRLAAAAGIAGCSVEDFSRGTERAIYPAEFAAERVAAAAEVARNGAARIALTARAENFLHGRRDLTDTIARLQAFQKAGADALFAPGLTKLDDIGSVVSSVDLPVSVLLLPGGPTVAQLASVGVARVSVGGALAMVSYGAVANAARALLEHGTHDYWELAGAGRSAWKLAFV